MYLRKHRDVSIIGTRKVMNFVDGQFLRECLQEILGNYNINYIKFAEVLAKVRPLEFLVPELVRTYYYFAVPAEKIGESMQERVFRERENAYLEKLSSIGYEIRLGRWKHDRLGRPRIKGINTLIALDMISKAYENHYDIAVLLARDEELTEVIKAVKDAGKRVHGVFFKRHIIPELRNHYDNSVTLHDNSIKGMEK